MKHRDIDHISICKEHQSIQCDRCECSVIMEDSEYWRDRGLEMFVSRHKHCDEHLVVDHLEKILSGTMKDHFLSIGATLIGETLERRVLCLIHEGEPCYGGSKDGDSDNFVVNLLTIDQTHEALELNPEQILSMNEQCPYVLLAIDGMRHIRELGWGEIAELWQLSIDKIVQHLAMIKNHIN